MTELWIKANYMSNHNPQLAVEAPESLKQGTIKDVIDFLMSNSCANQLKKFSDPDTLKNELDIIEEIKGYMLNYETTFVKYKEAKSLGKKIDDPKFDPRGLCDRVLVVEIRQADGTWYSGGTELMLPDLTKPVAPYITKTEISGHKFDVLDMKFTEIPWC